MSTSVQLTPKQLEKSLCFNYSSVSKHLTIECNYCSGDGYMFSDDTDNVVDGWIERATSHIVKYHMSKLGEIDP